ncbi:MAG: PaaI family thioesterase [Sulfurimonas sp.]|uniref:PaaI family thioesterase n=1 Tax=Sulfurimonas sp. TaxID=2022749 RepID=UPI00261219AA|nr:PaaI family thioesterase [Sulfurimonas sp.]MCW8894923.1 PaaI family thioesterase [Sulfurimonas sp.]MCW8954399.1 PaaI family thioesterase [Sulfurimonas sp.]MCW9068203.1 PaaI family thioesterase [Sulfurimonas sp.]
MSELKFEDEVEEELSEKQEKDLNIEQYSDKNEVDIRTHQKINHDLCGEIQKLENGYVELKLVTTHEMIADDQGLIHGGFIFSAADYAAMLAVNEKNVVLVGSDCQFLSPVKFGDIVNFVAKVRHKEGRKRNVHVTGHVLNIKVFEAELKTVVTERHVLKLNLLEAEKED